MKIEEKTSVFLCCISGKARHIILIGWNMRARDRVRERERKRKMRRASLL